MPKYPTEWSYGIPRGSVNYRKTNYILRISLGKDKDGLAFTFKIKDFASKEECEAHVEKIKSEKSNELGLTRNRVRFLDKNTIEIQLTCDKTFITDAKNLGIVNKYPLFAKPKKEKGITRYYVTAQDYKKKPGVKAKKIQFLFTDLLNDYKIVQYINGNSLDLRECNMKEFGLGYSTVTTDDETGGDMVMENHAVNYFWDPEDLPKNQWILGSIPGTIFYRGKEKGKILTMRVKDDKHKQRTKTFNIKNYDSEGDMRIEATIFLINIAHKFGMVQNPIRINDNYLEIMIEENIIMKTDLIFIPLFMVSFNELVCDATICKATSESNDKIYAAINLKNANIIMNFHKFIMGSPMIDHINGDPLDNRLGNLRFTNYENNNYNRHSNTDLEHGVDRKTNKYGEYYISSLTNKDVAYRKVFHTNIYGPKAKSLANSFRKNVLEINFTLGDIDNIHFDAADLATITNSLERTKAYQRDLLMRTIIDPKDYLFGYDQIDLATKKSMHKLYLKIQTERYQLLDNRIDNLEEIRNKIMPKKWLQHIEV